MITETDAADAPEARVDAWLAAHAAAVGRYRDLVHDVEQADAADLAALAVVRRALARPRRHLSRPRRSDRFVCSARASARGR